MHKVSERLVKDSMKIAVIFEVLKENDASLSNIPKSVL